MFLDLTLEITGIAYSTNLDNIDITIMYLQQRKYPRGSRKSVILSVVPTFKGTVHEFLKTLQETLLSQPITGI